MSRKRAGLSSGWEVNMTDDQTPVEEGQEEETKPEGEEGAEAEGGEAGETETPEGEEGEKPAEEEEAKEE